MSYKTSNCLEEYYCILPSKIKLVRNALGKPLTLTEKILYTHISEEKNLRNYVRGLDYVSFAPDRVAMQDATAQMALLQFINAGQSKTAVPTSVHCDHLILANKSAKIDLKSALDSNKEVFDFLQNASNRFGIDFWKPGAGIIHQVILENYALPGMMMIGTDSHTPNAGGLGMLAIGVGGADAVDVMAGIPWELKMPKIIGVKLVGKLSGWASPKDVILKLAGILTVKGGTDSVIEYFGEGASSISATGKATICNMGAEIGATTSIFPYDENIEKYLRATGRSHLLSAINGVKDNLVADKDVELNPSEYYDDVIMIDLNVLEPHVNGPYTPDAAYPISMFANVVNENKYPQKLEVGLIGSCTNSSYEDLTRAASVIRNAREKNIPIKSQLIINPGSEQVRFTAERDGILDEFIQAGAVIMANACGPCIGQWKREIDDENRANSILTSFNRNFAKRNDGNSNTHAFVSSPEIVAALAIAGDLCFNPMTDTLQNEKGEKIKLNMPEGNRLPNKGFEVEDAGFIEPNGNTKDIEIDKDSDRLQLLVPFEENKIVDFQDLSLLIKVKGKCTTDHISMAGKWLKYRGHLDNISNNMLIGAVNDFNDTTNAVRNPFTKKYMAVPQLAREFKDKGIGSVVIAEENYGEGSSREHAAMEPRFLNVKVIIVKSFARIHETNLKKQGVLALKFLDKNDYSKIREDDKINIVGLEMFKPNSNLKAEINHQDGTQDIIELCHTYNPLQIEWFEAGSALNYIRKK